MPEGLMIIIMTKKRKDYADLILLLLVTKKKGTETDSCPFIKVSYDLA